MGYSSFLGFFSVAIEVAIISLNLLFLYSCAFIKAKREKIRSRLYIYVSQRLYNLFYFVFNNIWFDDIFEKNTMVPQPKHALYIRCQQFGIKFYVHL